MTSIVSLVRRPLINEVLPIEIFDLMVGQCKLEKLFSTQDVNIALSTFIDQYFDPHQKGLLIPSKFDRHLTRLVICGRRSLNYSAEKTISKGLPLEILSPPDFPAAIGGQVMLQGFSQPYVVIDLGQTSTKISFGKHNHRFERDFALHPLSGVPNNEREAENLANTIALQVKALLSKFSMNCRAAFIAVPCEVSPSGDLSWCSYAGIYEGSPFMQCLARALKIPEEHLVLMNDAEAAAVSAIHSIPLECGATLLMTLGFSVGGAIICIE